MRICVYGAGAIGGYMAVMLKRGGADVSLIARGPHLRAIQERGLTVRADGEEIVERMTASEDPAAIGLQDYVIIALKAHQAWETAAAITPLLRDETAVVTAQNGLPWWYFHGLDPAYADLQPRWGRIAHPCCRMFLAAGPSNWTPC
ncbi:ketopantoate reductase family protein [Paracoccus wurundjeri]|uniref:ketopantoate reductase family protein n=1 Tax=Paracoccus onubensis TaxID=1675788 RepID=UPI00351CFB5C